MKIRTLVLVYLGLVLSSPSVFARKETGGFDRKYAKSAPEIVKWIGEVKDDASDHTTEHQHALKFVRQDDGKTYDIVDSPELVNLHHKTEKNYLVEIEAQKTPRFLFGGGNLIVRNFKILNDLDSNPHSAPAPTSTYPVREFRGGR